MARTTDPKTAATAEAQPTETPRRAWLRRVGYAFRVAVVAFVLWISWSSAATFRDLLRDDSTKPAASAAAPAQAGAPLDWSQALNSGGGWSFDRSGWSVKLLSIGDAKLSDELSRPLADPAVFAPPLETERAILDILRQIRGTETSGFNAASQIRTTDHSYESPTFRYFAHTREVDGVQRVCWARGAIRRDQSEWTLLEAQPASSTAATAGSGVLLAYPDASKLIASRLDSHGGVGCEFVRTPGTLAELVAFWRGRGVVAESQSPATASPSSGEVLEYFCRSQGRSFQVAALAQSTPAANEPTPDSLPSGTTVMVVALDVVKSASPSATISAP